MADQTEPFPWLEEHERFRFPDPSDATPEGIVGAGGNLSPGVLLSAYSQGVFPWFSEGDPVLWWSPDPRFVILPETLHCSKTMRKVLRQKRFRLTVDSDFGAVIRSCASVPRAHEDGTWITDQMQQAYIRLHELGYAHSVEARLNGELVGGLYGVSLGRVFFGESMFSFQSDASKAAFIPFARYLFSNGFALIDSQVYTGHLSSLGGVEIPRDEFLSRLYPALRAPSCRGNWSAVAKCISACID